MRSRSNWAIEAKTWNTSRPAGVVVSMSSAKDRKPAPAAWMRATIPSRSCSERLSALKPVMAAAADGMGDWKQHLADMRHSRMDHVADAEKIWLDAWKAAPPHIEAFDQAEKTYEDAPAC